MREIRMEVVSYDEAVEICDANGWIFDKVYMGRGVNHGKIMMLAYSTDSNPQNYEEDEIDTGLGYIDNLRYKGMDRGKIDHNKYKSAHALRACSKANNKKAGESASDIKNVVIYAEHPGGMRMFVAKKQSKNSSTTFNINEAKLFKEADAKIKVFMMNRNGTYKWKMTKITGRL